MNSLRYIALCMTFVMGFAQSFGDCHLIKSNILCREATLCAPSAMPLSLSKSDFTPQCVITEISFSPTPVKKGHGGEAATISCRRDFSLNFTANTVFVRLPRIFADMLIKSINSRGP